MDGASVAAGEVTLRVDPELVGCQTCQRPDARNEKIRTDATLPSQDPVPGLVPESWFRFGTGAVVWRGSVGRE